MVCLLGSLKRSENMDQSCCGHLLWACNEAAFLPQDVLCFLNLGAAVQALEALA